jgi:hypothetical protein
VEEDVTVIVAIVVRRNAKDKRVPRGVIGFKERLAYRVQDASIVAARQCEEQSGEYLETKNEGVGDSSMRNS